MKRVNPYKIVGNHPYVDGAQIDLRWSRGACRYNNGCTHYGNKYLFRLIISRVKFKVLYSDVPALQNIY